MAVAVITKFISCNNATSTNDKTYTDLNEVFQPIASNGIPSGKTGFLLSTGVDINTLFAAINPGGNGTDIKQISAPKTKLLVKKNSDLIDLNMYFIVNYSKRKVTYTAPDNAQNYGTYTYGSSTSIYTYRCFSKINDYNIVHLGFGDSNFNYIKLNELLHNVNTYVNISYKIPSNTLTNHYFRFFLNLKNNNTYTSFCTNVIQYYNNKEYVYNGDNDILKNDSFYGRTGNHPLFYNTNNLLDQTFTNNTEIELIVLITGTVYFPEIKLIFTPHA
jgi:hypothetical protein